MRYRFFALCVMMTACGGAQFFPESKKKNTSDNNQSQDVTNKACLNLVNGVETSDQEAVVIIETASGYCTGTFVSDSTLITAAHCAHDKSPTGGIRYKKINPLHLTHYGKLAGSKSKVWQDLMIVTFPEGTSKSFVSLNNVAPKVGDRIQIIGFGQTDLIRDNKPDGKKRKGFNTITKIQENNTVLTYEAPRSHEGITPGEKAMTGRGDSGGPIFAEGGGLVGIVSRGSLEPNLTEYDVNLFSTESLKLMEAAITRGSKITGIENVRSHLDPNGNLKGTEPLSSSALAATHRCL